MAGGVGGVGGFKGGTPNGPQFNSFLQGMRAKHVKLQDTDPLLIRRFGGTYLSLRDIPKTIVPAVRRFEFIPGRDIAIFQESISQGFLLDHMPDRKGGYNFFICPPNSRLAFELKKGTPALVNGAFAITYEGRDLVRYLGRDIFKIESLDMDGIRLLLDPRAGTDIDPEKMDITISNGVFRIQEILLLGAWKKLAMDTIIKREDESDLYTTAQIFPVKLSPTGDVAGCPDLYAEKDEYYQFYVAVLSNGECRILQHLEEVAESHSMDVDIPLPVTIAIILAGIEKRLNNLPHRWIK
ncbi:hypothetical protein ACFLZ2_04295 [Candidatus Margulisiibacteriota bacterium]